MTALGVGLSLAAPSLDGASTRIRYTMQGGEVLSHLAERYGSSETAQRRDNPGRLERGRVLPLQATLLPPPWQRLKVTVGERDWSTLAERHGLLATDLRAQSLGTQAASVRDDSGDVAALGGHALPPARRRDRLPRDA